MLSTKSRFYFIIKARVFKAFSYMSNFLNAAMSAYKVIRAFKKLPNFFYGFINDDL